MGIYPSKHSSDCLRTESINSEQIVVPSRTEKIVDPLRGEASSNKKEGMDIDQIKELIRKGTLLKKKLKQLGSNQLPGEVKEAYGNMCEVLEVALMNGPATNLPPFDEFLGRLSTEAWCVNKRTLPSRFFCGHCNYSSLNPDEWDAHLSTKDHTQQTSLDTQLKDCEVCGLCVLGPRQFTMETESNPHHLIYDELFRCLNKRKPLNKEPEVTKNEESQPSETQDLEVFTLDVPDIQQSQIWKDIHTWAQSCIPNSLSNKAFFLCHLCSSKEMNYAALTSHLCGKNHIAACKTKSVSTILVVCKLCTKYIIADKSGLSAHKSDQKHLWMVKQLGATKAVVTSSLESLDKESVDPSSLNVYKVVQPTAIEISSGLRKVVSTCKLTTYWNHKLNGHQDISSIIKEVGFEVSTPKYRCMPCKVKPPNVISFFQHIVSKKHTDVTKNESISLLLCKFCEAVFFIQNRKDIKSHFLSYEHKQKIAPSVEPSLTLRVFILKNNSLDSVPSITIDKFELINTLALREAIPWTDKKHGSILYACELCNVKLNDLESFKSHSVSSSHQQRVVENKDAISAVACEDCRSFSLTLNYQDHFKGMIHTRRQAEENRNANRNSKEIAPLVKPNLPLRVFILDCKAVNDNKIDEQSVPSITLVNVEKIDIKAFVKAIPWANKNTDLKHGSILYVCELCKVKVDDLVTFKSHLVSSSHQQRVVENKDAISGVACEDCRSFSLTLRFQDHVKGMIHLRRQTGRNRSDADEVSKESLEELWKKFELCHIVDHDANDYGHEKYAGNVFDDASILAFIRQETRSQHDFAYSCDPCRKEFLFSPDKLVAHLKTRPHIDSESFYGICCHICGSFIVSNNPDVLTSHKNSLSHMKDVAEKKQKDPETQDQEESVLAFAYITCITNNGIDKIETPHPTGVTNDEEYMISMTSWVQQHFKVTLKKFVCCQCVISTKNIKQFYAHRITGYHLQKERTALSNLVLCLTCSELHFFPRSSDCSYHLATSSHAAMVSSYERQQVSKSLNSLQKLVDEKIYPQTMEKSKADSLREWRRRSAIEENEEQLSLRSESTKNGDRSVSRATSGLSSSASSVVMDSAPNSQSDVSLDTVLKNIKDATKMTKSAKRVIKADLQALLSDHFPKFEVNFLGSRELGIGKKEDAIDIVIDPGVPIDETYAQTLMRLLNSSESLFKVIDPDPGNRIMTTSLTIDFPCCFHLVEPSIVEFSKLVKTFKDLDERVQYSLVSIRLWAEEIRLTQDIPAYCIDWLVLFYLMQPSVRLLPSAQLLFTVQTGKTFEKGMQTSFETDVKKIREVFNPKEICSKSSTEILDGFYDFYSVLSFKNIVMSPLTGKRYPRSAFETSESIPDPYPKTYDFSTMISDPVVLIDPLSSKTNLLSSISKGALAAFQEGCRNLIEDSDD